MINRQSQVLHYIRYIILLLTSIMSIGVQKTQFNTKKLGTIKSLIQNSNQKRQNHVQPKVDLVYKSSLTYIDTKKIQPKFEQKPSILTQGLPNVGFTCFLNSVLQLLYSAQEFRSAVISKQKSELQILLSNIFTSISDMKCKQDKIACMKAFVQYAKKQISNYEINTQQDALQFLFFILGQIEDNHPEIVEQFRIGYTSQCKCNSQVIQFTELSIAVNQLRCSKCYHILQIRLKKCPKYMICLGPTTKIQNAKPLKKIINDEQIQYTLISKVCYSGNGRSGHYINSRKVNTGEFYTFDDEFVSRRQTYFGKALLLMYVREEELENKSNQTKQKFMTASLQSNTDLNNRSNQFMGKKEQNKDKSQDKKKIIQNQDQISIFFHSLSKTNIDIEKQWNKRLTYNPIKKPYQTNNSIEINKYFTCRINVIKSKTQNGKFKFQKRRIVFSVNPKKIQNQVYYYMKIENIAHFYYFNKTNPLCIKAKSPHASSAPRFIDFLKLVEDRMQTDATNHPEFKEDPKRFLRLDYQASTQLIPLGQFSVYAVNYNEEE